MDSEKGSSEKGAGKGSGQEVRSQITFRSEYPGHSFGCALCASGDEVLIERRIKVVLHRAGVPIRS